MRVQHAVHTETVCYADATIAKSIFLQYRNLFRNTLFSQNAEVSSGAKLLSEYTAILNQANAKYVDALSVLTDQRIDNDEIVFHAGRSYCQIGEYSKGMAYLKNFISDSSTSAFKTLARFYFAYAMSKSITLIDSNPKVILFYLIEGLQGFLSNLGNKDKTKKLLVPQNAYYLLNPAFCEAFLTIGKIRNNANVKFDCMSSRDAFR